MADKHHIEFEHKFLVDADFDFLEFRERLERKKPEKSYDIAVEDHYFYSPSNPTFIYRHRCDQQLNQLSYKSVGKDSEQRTEINLDLLPGLPKDSVDAFIKTIGHFESKLIKKDVSVFYFKDVEIVYYAATDGQRFIYCVEFEVRDFKTKPSALEVLLTYEQDLGFDPQNRCGRSLLELFSQHEQR